MRVTAEDYGPLKAFLAWMAKHVLRVPESLSPEAVLAGFESRSMSTARKGLGMAVGDIVEMTDRFSAEEVGALDAALAAEGLPTLSEVRARFARTIRAIMKRGNVRSEREFYALRNVVEAMAEPERAEAWRLLGEFESRAR